MAIVNGKKLYNSRRLAAAAAIEGRAASEYAWMMAGTADDWGRFEANPRVIVGNAYKLRPDVTEADVARWLKLFDDVRVSDEEHGLIRTYEVDGVLYAEWTNYTGDSESQRKHHSCPEPPWSKHRHHEGCKLWGAASKRVTRGSRSRSIPRGTPKAYTSEQSVPPGPSETDLSGNPSARAREASPPPTAQLQPRREPAAITNPRQNPLVIRDKLITEGYRLIRDIAGATDQDPTAVIARASTGNGRYPGPRKAALDALTDDRLALTVADLREEWARLEPSTAAVLARPMPDPEPAAIATWDRIAAELEARLSPHTYATWFRSVLPARILKGCLHVHVPTQDSKAWLDSNYGDVVREATTAAGVDLRVIFGVFDRPPPEQAVRQAVG